MGSNLSSTKTTTFVLPGIAIHELTQELSCPICWEIFFEPCTTPCGHNFCRKCLQLQSNRCPICRNLIGIGRSCTVNSILWNTIEQLFPKEVEAREAIDALNNPRNFRAQQPCGACRRGLNYLRSDLSSTTCIHRLTRGFSCSLCWEIFFEPSTTPCGHNFCRKCLPSFTVNSGQSCPICRQWISNGRPCSVNIVLWNITQLLFPQKVEARKAIYALDSSRNLRAQSYGGSSSDYSSLDFIGKGLHNIYLGLWISAAFCAIYEEIKRLKNSCSKGS